MDLGVGGNSHMTGQCTEDLVVCGGTFSHRSATEGV